MNLLTGYPQNPFVLEKAPNLTATDLLTDPVLRIVELEIQAKLGNSVLKLIIPELPNYMQPLISGVWGGMTESLAEVPAHLDAGRGIRRFRFKDAPYHSALHVVDDGSDTTPNYCTVHTHDDVAELNVITPSQDGMIYNLEDGTGVAKVTEPTALWFPPGIPHCAYAQSGSGLFYVARMPINARIYYDQVAPGPRMVNSSLVDPHAEVSAFEQQYGKTFFEYLEQNTLAWALFNLKMETSLRDILPSHAIARLPLPKNRTVADVGGGLGYLLSQVKAHRPTTSTVLCDLPFVIKQARIRGNQADELWAGDAFEDQLPSADIYLLSRVLHDWQQEDSLRLLRNIRRSAQPGSELRVVDTFLNEDGTGPDYAIRQQCSMDLLFKSRQHTTKEMMSLLSQAGWVPAPTLTKLTDDMWCISAKAE
jgi:ubiquinone/menaquinone biosynthesis C-methylase UbiE